MGVRYASLGNPFYPLPPDYDELTVLGQREARRNVLMNRETVEDEIISSRFFSAYYLDPEYERAGWYVDYSPPPSCHDEWVAICAQHDRVALGASRGFGKSVKFQEFLLRDALTVQQFIGLLVLSSQKKVAKALSKMIRQFENNERILDDFGVVYQRGRAPALIPPRGSRYLCNTEIMQLLNGASVEGLSVTSRSLRGERPKRILVDDPEYDPKEGTSLDKMIADMETLLFTVLIPMLRRGSALHWIGTPIQRKLFLWRIIAGEDPRIDSERWWRGFFPLVSEHGESNWPDEYPEEEIEKKRIEAGSNFGSEYMCCPTSGEYAPLELDRNKNGYFLTGDPRNTPDPLNAEVEVEYLEVQQDKAGTLTLENVKKRWPDVVKDMLRFITVDSIRVPGPQSDWAVCHVMGVDKQNQLWSLDIWAGKLRYVQLAHRMWAMTAKWRCRVMGIECIGLDAVMRDIAQMGVDKFSLQYGYRPKIVLLNDYEGTEKEDRIMALETRISNGLLKVPFQYQTEKYHYGPLFQQIELFTPDGGNLDHDDHVDTLAMGHWMLRKRPLMVSEVLEDETRPEALLKRGQTNLDGLPVALMVDWQTVNGDKLLELLHKAQHGQQPERSLGGWTSGSL